MDSRKHGSPAFLGFRHFLIGGVIGPVGVAIVLVIFGLTLFPQILQFANSAIGPLILQIAGVVLGVWYSARNLQNTYRVTQVEETVLISAGWFVTLELIIGASQFLSSEPIPHPFMLFLQLVLSSLLFYLMSRRFIKPPKPTVPPPPAEPIDVM